MFRSLSKKLPPGACFTFIISSHWKMAWRKSILEFLMSNSKLVKIYGKSFKTICSGVYFSSYSEFLCSKYLGTVSFILKIQAINLSMLPEHMFLLFVNCFPKTFHIWYRNLQNFSLTQEDKQWKHENIEREQCFWYNFFSIFGVSEDFEAFFSVRLKKFFSMNLILLLCVFNV